MVDQYGFICSTKTKQKNKQNIKTPKNYSKIILLPVFKEDTHCTASQGQEGLILRGVRTSQLVKTPQNTNFIPSYVKSQKGLRVLFCI